MPTMHITWNAIGAIKKNETGTPGKYSNKDEYYGIGTRWACGAAVESISSGHPVNGFVACDVTADGLKHGNGSTKVTCPDCIKLIQEYGEKNVGK